MIQFNTVSKTLKNGIEKILLIWIILTGCNTVEVPKERLYQFYTNARGDYKHDSIYLYLNNPVDCPIRYYISSSDTALDKKLKRLVPVTLQQKKDTTIKVSGDSLAARTLSFPSTLGDLRKKIIVNKLSLPFPENRSYKIIQGYNGSHSHHRDDKFSCYAIDFGLEKNDTVCAADNGVVVGVIEDYKYGGNDKRLLEHANLITVYHPHSGLFTQYVHLVYRGSFVSLGDKVRRGQPIGLAGTTGFTDVEHLHFNVLAPAIDGLQSVKIAFEEGYEGENLKRHDRVKK